MEIPSLDHAALGIPGAAETHQEALLEDRQVLQAVERQAVLLPAGPPVVPLFQNQAETPLTQPAVLALQDLVLALPILLALPTALLFRLVC